MCPTCEHLKVHSGSNKEAPGWREAQNREKQMDKMKKEKKRSEKRVAESQRGLVTCAAAKRAQRMSGVSTERSTRTGL